LLAKSGAAYFGVAFLEEALTLRKAGINTPILVLGGISGRQIDDFILHDIDITASSISKLQIIDERARVLGKTAQIQVKIDTGMERVGTHYYSAETLLKEALEAKHCKITGILSHFATSEQSDLSFARLQLERFLECCEFFERRSEPTPLRHIANSGAILQLPESHLDMVRPGLILYGISPLAHRPSPITLNRVLSLRSEVVYFKVIRPGAGVSYDHIWHADRQTRIVTIPAGYGDGFPRRLSTRGSVLIRGKRYPIVGKICMDQFMADIGDGEAYNGDEVVLIGRQGEEEITVEEIAAIVDTDPREILLATNLRVPRRFHLDGQTFVE
jgi:alanine racemase